MTRLVPLLLALATAAVGAAPIAAAPASKPPHPQPILTPAPAPDAAALAAARAKVERLEQATRPRRLAPYPVPRADRARAKPVARPTEAPRPFDPSALAPSQREKLARGEAELRARENAGQGRRTP
jgi:hypothetical protein